jgi:hypothetical protein
LRTLHEPVAPALLEIINRGRHFIIMHPSYRLYHHAKCMPMH